MLISPEYAEQNARLHAENPWYGVRGVAFIEEVKRIAGELGVKELLDYGCGKQRLRDALGMNYTVYGYDPGIAELSASPPPCDFVVCFDVLEHVEPEYLSNVLDDLRRVAVKALLMSVATRKAKKVLPDGRNAHLIIEPIEWWLPQLRERFSIKMGQFSSTEFVVLMT